ncbi:MAG: hypothetical protein H8E37_07780 [Planctomycetes bacterium]|nr:hypothetical protein [Planctomycetota bacterium]
MHILGKILSVFVIGGAIASVILASRTLQVRKEWNEKVEIEQLDYEKSIDPLENAKKTVLGLQHERDVAAYQWHPYFTEGIVVQPNVVQTNPGDRATWKFGVAISGLGPVSGIRTGEIIQLFSPGANAESTHYLGPFKVTQVIPTPPTITAETTWGVRGLDMADDPDFPGQTVWESPVKYRWGNGWRVRTALPNEEPINVTHYSQLLLKKDEQLAATKVYKTTTEEQKVVADTQLTYRENELHGDVNLEQRNLPRYRIDGLVKAISDADETRNATLEEVDALRHRLKKVYDDVVALQEQNRRIAAELPGADDVDATTAAATD